MNRHAHMTPPATAGSLTARGKFSDPITDEEEAEIQAAIAADPDTWEATAEEIANARPFAEVFPELAVAFERKEKEDQAAVEASGGSRSIVTLVLDTDVLDRFQASGDDWQARINDILKKAVA